MITPVHQSIARGSQVVYDDGDVEPNVPRNLVILQNQTSYRWAHARTCFGYCTNEFTLAPLQSWPDRGRLHRRRLGEWPGERARTTRPQRYKMFSANLA